MNFEFCLNTNAKFGEGTARNLSGYLKELSLNKIGLIIDAGVQDVPYVKEITANVENSDFKTVKKWIYDLQREPDYESLDKIRLHFLNKNAEPLIDCFVGIGGGSVLDFAKGLSTLVVNLKPALTYRGFPKNQDINRPLPMIALPTTAGTGSEVTYNAVFTDRQGKMKFGINTKYNFPALAIIDPLLTISCPQLIIASTGMDAIVHTLESYVATKANPLTRFFAKGAFKILFNNLPKVIKAPQDLEARINVQYGSYLAGISLMNSGSGPAGALSYSLGVHFNIAHGIAGGLFLPHIVAHNAEKGFNYSELYDLIENADLKLDAKTKSRQFATHIFFLRDALGIPSNLRSFGINQKNLTVLLEEVPIFEKAFEQNPIPFSVSQGQNLLKKLIR